MFGFCPKCGHRYSDQKNPYALACPGCGFTLYSNSKPTASALIVRGKKILLGKRSIEPAKGEWDVIGGFLNFGEHPEDGVRREVKEETGLDITIDKFFGFFMDTYGDTGDATLNICFVVTPISNAMVPGDDIEELQWFAPQAIPKQIAFKNGQDMIDAWLKEHL